MSRQWQSLHVFLLPIPSIPSLPSPSPSSLGVEPVDHQVIMQPPRKTTDAVITKSLLLQTCCSALLILLGTLWVFWTEASTSTHSTHLLHTHAAQLLGQLVSVASLTLLVTLSCKDDTHVTSTGVHCMSGCAHSDIHCIVLSIYCTV